MMDTKKAYYKVLTDIWALFRADLSVAHEIKSPEDPRWIAACDRYEAIVAAAPADLQDYADSMIRMHVYELEKQWRWK